MGTLADHVSERYPGVFDISVPYVRKVACDHENLAPCAGEHVTTSDNAVLTSWPGYLKALAAIDLSGDSYAKLVLPTNVTDRCVVGRGEHSPFESGSKSVTCGRNYDVDDPEEDDCLANQLVSFDAKKAVVVDGEYTVRSVERDDTMDDSERRYYDDIDKKQMDTFMSAMAKVHNTLKRLHADGLYINNLSEHYIYVSDGEVVVTNLTEVSRIPQMMLDEVCLIALYCSRIGDHTLLDEMYEKSPVSKNKDLKNFVNFPPASAGMEGGGSRAMSMLALLGVVVVMSMF